MKVFTYSEARQNFSAILDRAQRDGAVMIRRRDGRVFVLRPNPVEGSPLDVPGLSLDIGRDELASFVREGRRPVE